MPTYRWADRSEEHAAGTAVLVTVTGIDRRGFLLSCLAVSVAGCSRSIRGWPHGYVSLTYDDGLSSQLDVAVPQLEQAGLRGTFYLTWDNMKERAADWAALVRRGHELGNHTVTHPCDLRRETVEGFKASEIDPMQRWLAQVEGAKRSRDFAYPCDVTNLGPGNANRQADTYAKVLQSAGISHARTSEGPPNSLQWAEDAPYRLQALALGYDAKNESDVRTYLSQAMTGGKWAILVLHGIDMGRRSDGSISPLEHERLLNMIKQMRIPCGTVESAIKYAGIRAA
jgi:peptidoglycan/xylan/chitin deacetylase (PgdA/CDA1 family)